MESSSSVASHRVQREARTGRVERRIDLKVIYDENSKAIQWM